MGLIVNERISLSRSWVSDVIGSYYLVVSLRKEEQVLQFYSPCHKKLWTIYSICILQQDVVYLFFELCKISSNEPVKYKGKSF